MYIDWFNILWFCLLLVKTFIVVELFCCFLVWVSQCFDLIASAIISMFKVEHHL